MNFDPSSSLINPYNYSEPVTDPAHFAGRRNILKKIDYCLNLATSPSPQFQNLAILGSRGVGKTSLVNQLVNIANPKYNSLCVKTKLNNELIETENALFNQIFQSVLDLIDQIKKVFRRHNILTRIYQSINNKLTLSQIEVNFIIGKVKTTLRTKEQLSQQELRNGLMALRQESMKLQIPCIILCFDEANLLSKNQTLLQMIRNTFENLDGFIIVLSGTSELFSDLNEVFSPIQRFFIPIRLGNFEKWEEVYECIKNPLPENLKGMANERFAQKVFDLTRGHPYFVKHLSFHAYKTAKEHGLKRMILSLPVLDAVLDESEFGNLDDIRDNIKKRRQEPFELDDLDSEIESIDDPRKMETEILRRPEKGPEYNNNEDMDEETRLALYSERIGIPFKKRILEDLQFNDTFDIPIHYFKRIGFVPLSVEGEILKAAINDPFHFQAVDKLARQMDCKSVKLILSPYKEINAAINLLFDQSSEDAEKMGQDLKAYESDSQVFRELDELEDLMDVTHEAPIIRTVNVILTQALRREASDIHIEPYDKEIKVRFRIDGILYEIFSLPKRFQAHIVSRLKVMANLDIAEKRVPQDGRIRIMVANRTVDIRVSIIPMAYGEQIVLRLLDKGVSLLGLGEMGLPQERMETFESLINKNAGILLVTGPTGSGKTTTLYASINRLNSTEKNIITIEDPIEYELKGVGQIQVNPKTYLTFASGLRSILRHDPDIIMVGEIRDLETVEIAMQASLTGHLVFSTLHTNDAAGALTRLVDMGVEPFLIASSLLAVVAQRLVRKICPECKESFDPDEIKGSSRKRR